MLRVWRILNRQRLIIRLVVKALFIAIVVLFVMFPKPSLLVTHLARWSDPESLIEPDHPVIREWVDEIRSDLPEDIKSSETLKAVETFVYKKVPYGWEWDVWGTVDYLPTVDEVMEKGTEDCDGRAVIAASMLSNLGFETSLVCDSMHVWVRTDAGDTMSPGKEPVAVTTTQGAAPSFNWSALKQLPRTAGFGFSVFPLARELILLAALVFIYTHPRQRVRWRITGTILLVVALFGSRHFGKTHNNPAQWGLWVSYSLAAVGFLTFWLSGLRKSPIPADQMDQE